MPYPLRLDSTGKTILVLGDIHQDLYRLKKIIKSESPDIVVTTGDWFDSFDYDEDYHVRDAAKFLLENHKNPNFVTCKGNHDVHYLFDSKCLPCSGYENRKNMIVRATLGQHRVAVRDSMYWYVWVDDYFVSHAGLHPSFLHPMLKIEQESIDKWMLDEIKKNEQYLAMASQGWFTQAGYGRGGSAPVGGLLWADFNCEFKPIEGLKQLVGHTPHKRITNYLRGETVLKPNIDNLDIDCFLNQYIIVRDKALTIKNYADL